MTRIRKATMNDVDTVFNIRNSENVRKNSWNTKLLDYNSHVAWFKNHFQFYWMIDDDKGFVRIIDGEVSIAIDSGFRNQGLGSDTLKLLCKDQELFASIRFGNPASFRCFCKAGFFPVGMVMKNKLIQGDEE